ncbi:MAG: hypothetical protein KatS3mg032_0116 [Cyclobacteriaceae bacterium]|nr:MAG: hypothetical protein KatS3mg032_0116 [Cyclobacteriaceae bacterium]
MRAVQTINLIITVLLLWQCDTPGTVDPVYRDYFIRYYGGNGNHEAADFLLTQQGSVIMVGNVQFSPSLNRMYLVITDLQGNVIAEKPLGSNLETARDIEPVMAGPDAGNYVILSNVKKNEADSLAIRLTVINSQGDSLKSFYYNTLASQEGYSVTPLSTGSFFVAGKTTDTDGSLNTDLALVGLTDREDQLVLLLNPDYSVNNISRIGGSTQGACVKILQGAGSFYYAGYSDRLDGTEAGVASNYENNFEFRQFVVNPASVPYQVVGTPDQGEVLAAIARAPSGNFLAIGTRLSASQSRMYGVFLTSNFTVIEGGVLPLPPGEFEGVSVCPSGGSRYLVMANRINTNQTRDIWIGRVNSEFIIDFQTVIGGVNTDDRAAGVMELPGGDIAVLSTMDISNQKKIALIKLRADGNFE